ncbi:MAG: hypothetical protein ABIU77_07090 [Ferruginibacter sp.]
MDKRVNGKIASWAESINDELNDLPVLNKKFLFEKPVHPANGVKHSASTPMIIMARLKVCSGCRCKLTPAAHFKLVVSVSLN